MALFPVQGIEQLDAEKIKFSSKSLPNFISFYPYFGTLVMMLLSLAWFIKKASLLRTLRIIFFGTSWISCALLRELAVHWPQLCRVWAKCEQTTNLGYPTNLTLKCHCFIFIYIMTAVCEHGLALSNAFSEAAACGDALRNLCTHWFPQVFNLVPFYRPLAIIIMTINTIATFTFNFVDLLLITTGYILANLLTQYNRVLEEDSHKVERFLLHVNNQSSEFSAFGFFTVTRTTIITIMSIVLSYEAIMHQFKTLMIDVEDGQALKRNASIDCSKYLQLGD
ncbi:gustatory receptor for sugar taste 64a-like isoform X4 [Nilaparvata lugens]|uniref:gustatory receptor for sugar taste 64a-like isoform X4 n=1 Tax=Nilaparvata lugens TaxID=108931 RepID=UPI00193E0D81|nr:gustatory receptor for sugar taste 64a-like isoform X4 [Nilaparvata lugens]